ncbi:MAG: FecR family protein [Thermovirgaceae bacterium]|nr:FecR family protein [Thermovirgaceae bacterium]
MRAVRMAQGFLLSVLLLVATAPVFAASGPEVNLVFGAAEITNSVTGVSRPVSQGESLEAGDVIVVESKGLVVMEEKDGSVKVLATGGSTLRFDGVTPDGQNQYEVPDGLIWFKVTPGTKLDVKTPTLVASVRGTEFGVMVSQGLASVAVLSGNVSTRDSIGRESTSGPGYSVSVSVTDITIEQRFEGPRREKEKQQQGSQGQGSGSATGEEASGETGSPGNSGSAPGQTGESPGKSGSAPGQSGDSPGNSGNSNAGGNSGKGHKW